MAEALASGSASGWTECRGVAVAGRYDGVGQIREYLEMRLGNWCFRGTRSKIFSEVLGIKGLSRI